MTIQMLGIDHTLASVDVRSVFAFTKKNAELAENKLRKKKGVSGCMILSTCNRTEIWVSATKDYDLDLINEICAMNGVSPENYRPYFIIREDDEAINHIFHLACGLRSKIIAEDQIVSQVGDALLNARLAGAADNVLEVLVRMAITASKRVKSNVFFSHANETAINRAVEMLEEKASAGELYQCPAPEDGTAEGGRGQSAAPEDDSVWKPLKGLRCLVIGNGEMGKLVSSMLCGQGMDVAVTVRQYKNGMVQVPAGCHAVDYRDRMKYIPHCSVVVSATSSPNLTLSAAHLARFALDHQITFIDLAVPRDIDLEVRNLPNISLYDIDDFNSVENEANDKAYMQAEDIIQEQIGLFYEWLNQKDMVPRVRALQKCAVTDLNARLTKVVKCFPASAEKKEELMENLDMAAEKTIGKILFSLMNDLDEHEFERVLEILKNIYD